MRLLELKGKSKEEVASLLGVAPDSLALERFVNVGLPTKKSEEYRYFQIEKLYEHAYTRETTVPPSIKEAEKIIITDGIVTHAPRGMRIYYELCQTIDESHFDPMYY